MGLLPLAEGVYTATSGTVRFLRGHSTSLHLQAALHLSLLAETHV